MPKKIRNKKSRQVSVIISSLFLLFSIPLVVYGLFQKSFDIRNQAYDMLELSEKNPCIISFPNVNPYSLEVGKSIRIQIDAKLSNSGIKKLELTDANGEVIHVEEFPDSPLQIGRSFVFTPVKSGSIEILGRIERTDGKSHGCKISSPYDIKGLRAIASNSSPEFTTNPTQSKPSQDIKTGVQYEYQLSALDTDGDRINYSYSFTPRADWLKPVIVEDGSNGKLTIMFRGYSDQPASYLANVIIHDGYSKNVRSQSWVVSVEQAENDIPKVRIINPEDSFRIDAGNSFDSAWEVSDLNHISSFELFMARNVTDENTWKKIGDTLPYNVLNSPVSTSGLDSGTYKLVVKATDNQSPKKSGLGVSPEIVISRLSDNMPPSDDVVVLGEPQIINMSPSTEDEVSNPRTIIKGSLIASEDAEIKDSTITFKVDGKDITDKMKINEISKIEYTLIYQPTEDLEEGSHQAEISFEDTKGKKVVKSWDFTINSTSDTSGSYNIFGMEISRRTVYILGIGILLIVIAICIPLLIAAIWGKGKREKKETSYTTRNIPQNDEYTKVIYGTPVNTEGRRRDEAEEKLPTEEHINKENIFTPVVEEVKEDIPESREVYSNIQDIETEDILPIQVEEEIIPVQPIQTDTVIDTNEPKSAFDVPTQPENNIEPKTEEIIPVQPIQTDAVINTNEPKSAVDVPTQPENSIEPKTEDIIEPDAPDPSAFLKIAQQIEEQTTTDSANS